MIFGFMENLTTMNDFIARYPTAMASVWLAGLLILAYFLSFVSRAYLLRLVQRLTRGIPGFWVKGLIDDRLLARVSWLVPTVVIHTGVSAIPGLPTEAMITIQRIALAIAVVLSLRTIMLLTGNFHDTYLKLEVAKDRPIKGIIQVFLLLLHVLAAILIFSILLDRSPWVFLSGLGAMTAVLLLVFRDTLLSLVAGVQLTTNNLVRVGDWIEMPQFGADGDVVDIALHSVRVQNWDRTITVIPTHKFLEHSFKNWRGMQESGGRRIKRAVHIDISSIRFLSSRDVERFSCFALLREYVERKKQELDEYNRQYTSKPELIVNARRLTNIGTFRAYLIGYLRQHPRIHQKMTFLVRQLEPGRDGLPIEIYVFTNDTRWAVYEEIQADIFDHILAIAPEFGLRVYRNPTGHDIRVGIAQSDPLGGKPSGSSTAAELTEQLVTSD